MIEMKGLIGGLVGEIVTEKMKWSKHNMLVNAFAVKERLYNFKYWR